MFDVVLLAAGRGIRMEGANGNKPKCLMPLKSGTVLSDLIDKLSLLSPRKIKVVGGFGYENLKSYLEGHSTHLQKDIELIRNNKFELDRNIYSALIGQESMDANAGVLFVEADIVLLDPVLEKIKNYILDGRSFIGVSGRYHSKNTGGYVILDEFGYIVAIGYQQSFEAKLEGSHRMIGFLYVSEQDFHVDLNLRKKLCNIDIDNYYFASIYKKEHLLDLRALEIEENLVRSFNTMIEYNEVTGLGK